MHTIALYDMMVSAFEEIIKESDTSTKEAYERALRDARVKISEIAKRLRLQDPIMTPYYLPLIGETNTIEDKDVPMLLESIKDASRKRNELGLIYTGACSSKVVQRTIIQIPKFVDFRYKPHILVPPYEDQIWENFAVKMMNQIIFGCILALPKGNVRVNFINPSLSSKSSFISNNLPSDLCRLFIEKNEIREYLSSMVNRIKKVLIKGNIPDDGDTKYEIVVLLDYPYQFDDLTEEMRIIIEQGQQAGIHFIVLNDIHRKFDNERAFDVLSLKDSYFQEPDAFDNAKDDDFDELLSCTYQLCDQTALLNACINYLNCEKKEQIESETVISEKDYSPVDKGLNVAIGQPIDKKIIEFCLGQDGHVHSFIIGQTGTGKSVLLHDIIIEAIRKYSPEDLQIYFLDCKLGGVEFNRYKDVKHARALLVDNSDVQIILEILRDLSEQMRERGKLLRESGVQKIDEYNKIHPNDRMSRIWVVIDECHVIFEQSSTRERRAKNEMIEILTKVATEGRSQGVHLIMATQTLANADIPTAILNNITDRYILNCAPIDAEKLCANSSKIIISQGVGDVLYHNTTGKYPDIQFHAFYLSQDNMEKQINAAVEKAIEHSSNGQFYFNGSQIFNIDNEIINSIGKIRKENLKACVGRSISLKQVPVQLTLKQDMSENILLTGIDDQGQSMRTAMNLLVSLVACNIKNGLTYKFYVFDLKDDEEGQYLNVLEQLEDSRIVSIVKKREQGGLLKKLVDNIKNNVGEPTILMILGQQRFRELKMDVELEVKQESIGSLFGSNGFVTSSSNAIKTFKEALSYILDNGPDFHIHTILQVDKPSNLLYEDYVTSKFVLRKFRHLIMLKSDDKAALTLGLPDEIKLETLNSEPERLRAIYYADGDNGWTLFSPFAMPNKTELSNLVSNNNYG